MKTSHTEVPPTAVVGIRDVGGAGGGRIPVGASVGRFVVLEEVGRGGMGRVLRAYDPKLQREVALKEVRRDTLGCDGQAQLVAEARAMAKLSHSNVVSVFDVEELPETTGDGTAVVLVMEYVAGKTLATWMREEQRSWPEVLARFVDAGRGLVAAHDVGLLHRDFKPANVLLSEQRVKVTDFGLAKGMDATVVSHAGGAVAAGELTMTGAVVGTPRYMAPEQHGEYELGPEIDQYAFCISLWEALCGKPPFSGADLAEQKLQGPPPWPAVAVPGWLSDAIRRGLSVEPEDRWPDLHALLDVLARDRNRRVGRWVVAAGVATVAIAGLVLWSDARASRCSGSASQLEGVWDDDRRDAVQAALTGFDGEYAQAAWAHASEELDAYVSAWKEMHTEACEATSVRGEQSEAIMDLRMACLHRARGDLVAAVGVLATADADVVQNAQDVVGQLRSLDRCADVEALQAEVEPPPPREAEAVEQARTTIAEIRAEYAAGRFAVAQIKVDEARTLLDVVDYGPVRTEFLDAEGDVLEAKGEYDAAESAMEAALESAAKWRQAALMAELASKLMFMIGTRKRNPKEGLRYARLAAGLASDPSTEAVFRSRLSSVLRIQGEYERAETEARRALEIARNSGEGAAGYHFGLGIILRQRGRYEEAIAEARLALEGLRESLGPDHPRVADAHAVLSSAFALAKRHDEAAAEARRSQVLRSKVLPPSHPDHALSHNNLAIAYQGQGKFAEAEVEFRRALELWERSLGPDHIDVAMALQNVGATQQEQGKHEAAEEHFRRALSLLDETSPEHRPYAVAALANLSLALGAQGKLEEALERQRQALAIYEDMLGPNHPLTRLACHSLANLLQRVDRADEALPLAEGAWAHFEREGTPRERADSAYVLAKVLWQTGDDRARRQRARDLAEQARESYREAEREDDVAIVETWLGEYH